MELDIKLIDEIQKYECIYNLKSTDYKNRAMKDKIWEKIGDKLGLEVHICQKRWKSLRDTYKKHKLKKQKIPEQYEKRRPWSYFDCLTFLDNVQSTRRSFESSRTRNKVKTLDEDTTADFSQTTMDSCTIEEPMLFLNSPALKQSRETSIDSIEEMPQQFEEIFNKPTLNVSANDEDEQEEYTTPVKSKNCTLQLFEALANKVTSSNLTTNQINDIESSVVAFVYQKLAEVQSLHK